MLIVRFEGDRIVQFVLFCLSHDPKIARFLDLQKKAASKVSLLRRPLSSRNIFMGIALVRGRFACRQMFPIYILIVTALGFLLLGFEVVAFWLFVAGW